MKIGNGTYNLEEKWMKSWKLNFKCIFKQHLKESYIWNTNLNDKYNDTRLEQKVHELEFEKLKIGFKMQIQFPSQHLKENGLSLLNG